MKQEQGDDGDIVLSKKVFAIEKNEAELVNGIPVSGEDYLLLVRQQAESCTQTTIAPPPAKILQLDLPLEYQFTKDAPSNIDLLPDPAWQTLFDSCFKRFRKERQDMKHVASSTPLATKNHQQLHIFCTTCSMDDSTLLETIAPLPQTMILKLLKLNKEWLQLLAQKMSSNDQPKDKSYNFENLWKCHTTWLFSLLVYVDPVITSLDISILRDVCRACIVIRNSLQANSDQVIQLNIIITIISHCFGQSDLK
ncbi:survival motor neuron interacting protein 1-domain-containing protein [Absidia repens]|uniref:Gem-associated protein 2 n=1 Tax=Absidia repens TaxID=90262 RepID=A0A1X2IVV7_9FUNG|nr:survival motor neuron interacting protein 1-domain-containing protein [Absidia repens]